LVACASAANASKVTSEMIAINFFILTSFQEPLAFSQ
jgi:hypothetical protein